MTARELCLHVGLLLGVKAFQEAVDESVHSFADVSDSEDDDDDEAEDFALPDAFIVNAAVLSTVESMLQRQLVVPTSLIESMADLPAAIPPSFESAAALPSGLALITCETHPKIYEMMSLSAVLVCKLE